MNSFMSHFEKLILRGMNCISHVIRQSCYNGHLSPFWEITAGSIWLFSLFLSDQETASNLLYSSNLENGTYNNMHDFCFQFSKNNNSFL